MRRHSNVTTDTLYWVQPGLGASSFELFDDGRVVGTLKWEKGVWTRRVIAMIGVNRWTIERTMYQTWTVRDADSASDIAVYDAEFSRGFWSTKGSLTLPDGTTFWRTGKIWDFTWSFCRPDGATLIHFTGELTGMFEKRVRVELVPEARTLLELPLLLVLGAFVKGDPASSGS